VTIKSLLSGGLKSWSGVNAHKYWSNFRSVLGAETANLTVGCQNKLSKSHPKLKLYYLSLFITQAEVLCFLSSLVSA